MENHKRFARGPGRRRLVMGVFFSFWCLSCGDNDPSGLGSGTRSAPDTLHVALLRATDIDSVFNIPVTLGRSNIAQLGSRIAYTTHVLYALQLPTQGLDEVDSLLALEKATITIDLDSSAVATFSGTMRLELREVQAADRGWDPDSVTAVPKITSLILSPEVSLADDNIVGGKLEFDLNLSNLAEFDSLVALGDTLDLNLLLRFVAFDIGGPGFMEFPFTVGNEQSFQLNGFAGTSSLFTLRPARHLTVVAFDSTFSPGTNMVISDGFRMHTYLKFSDIRSVVPDSAIVHLAELTLTQVDSVDGSVFGVGPNLGVIVPSDTTMIFEESENTRALAFSGVLVATHGLQASMNVTAYMFDQQENAVVNRGMIFRLSNEGTKVRHFEFYGSQDPVLLRRPSIRIFYSMPADFEEGGS